MPSFMRLMNVITRCGAIYRAEHLGDAGLGESHHSFILLLCRHPGISQECLSRKLFLNKSNVTRALAQLENAGYVTRVPSEEDRRVMLVFPTEKAYGILPLVRETLKSWREYLTEELSDEEKAALDSILPKLASRAAEYAKISKEAYSDPDGEGGGA